MAKHVTYLFSEDARAQAEFYVQALGGEILSVMTHGSSIPDAKEELKDKVMHLSFIAGGAPFYMCDTITQPADPGNAIHQVMEYERDEEAHDAFNKLAEGGRVLDPLKPQFWGSLFGLLEDKYGVRWMITTEEKQV